MGRKRKSTTVLELSGAFRKNPARRRDGEPEGNGPLSSAPDDLTEQERAAWRMLCERAPVGVLTDSDWPLVVMAAKLFSEFMSDSAGFNAARLTRLHRVLADLGMSPPGRGSLSIPQKKADNPFAMYGDDWRG